MMYRSSRTRLPSATSRVSQDCTGITSTMYRSSQGGTRVPPTTYRVSLDEVGHPSTPYRVSDDKVGVFPLTTYHKVGLQLTIYLPRQGKIGLPLTTNRCSSSINSLRTRQAALGSHRLQE